MTRRPVSSPFKMWASATAVSYTHLETFTQEEVKILMEQLPDNKVGHTIRLMLATGMRTQEVLALEPQHIEPDGFCIHIRQAVNMVKGRPHIGPPKTANSVRDVPVPPSVRPCAVFLQMCIRDRYYTRVIKILFC